MKAYDQLADTYDTHRVTNLNKEENLLIVKHLLAQGYAVNDIIDAGCGTGLVIDYLDDYIRPGKYLGVDSSGEMIAVAKAKHPNYAFSHNDMRRIPVLNRVVDALVCVFGALSYLMTPIEAEDALREFSRVIRPGGRVFLMVWGPKALERGMAEVWLEGHRVPRRVYTAAMFQKFVLQAFEGARVWGMRSWMVRWLPGWTPRWFCKMALWVEHRTVGRRRPDQCDYLICEAIAPKVP